MSSRGPGRCGDHGFVLRTVRSYGRVQAGQQHDLLHIFRKILPDCWAGKAGSVEWAQGHWGGVGSSQQGLRVWAERCGSEAGSCFRGRGEAVTDPPRDGDNPVLKYDMIFLKHLLHSKCFTFVISCLHS